MVYNKIIIFFSTQQVTQSWFLLNPQSNILKNQTEYNSYKWYVPFTFTTKNKLAFDFESTTNWLKPNDSECKRVCLLFNIILCWAAIICQFILNIK